MTRAELAQACFCVWQVADKPGGEDRIRRRVCEGQRAGVGEDKGRPCGDARGPGHGEHLR